MEFVWKSTRDVWEKVNSLFDRREKLQFAGVIVVGIAAAFFQALGVASVLPFLDLVLDPGAVQENRWYNLAFTSLGFESALSFTIFVGFVMLAILIVGNLVTAASTWLKVRFVWQKHHSLSVALLRNYLFLPYVGFLNKHSADLGKTVLSEVHQLTNQLLMPFLEVLTNGIVVLVILFLLFFINPLVAAGAAFLFGFSYLAIYFFLQSRLREKGEGRLRENTGRFMAAGEALSGVKDIKAFGREGYFLERFVLHSSRFTTLQAWVGVAIHFPRYLMEVVAFGGVVALVLVFIGLRQDGGQIIPLVSFFAFAGYRLMPALQRVFQAASEIQFNRAVLDRISMDVRGEVSEPFASRAGMLPPRLPLQERIVLDAVSFQYPYATKPALRNVSLEIPRGMSVGFVGPTGGGKTTLVDVVIGLLSPTEGRLSVDGVEVREENVRGWQRNIGYVPQQIFLADDTVARNVALGLPDEDIDRKQVEWACKVANMHEFIDQELPGGYDTMVGERGIRLSGGQRQRIGIARALYHNPEVLVLDEATNALDRITETSVLEAVKALAGTKTLIVVAHRLATVRDCAVIYFIEKGRITASGTYGQLVEMSPSFRDMAQQHDKR